MDQEKEMQGSETTEGGIMSESTKVEPEMLQPREKRAKAASMLVVGVILAMAFPIAYVARFVLAFLLAVMFAVLCVMLPFMLPLVIPEGGEIDDVFGNIFGNMLADAGFPIWINVGLGVLTVVGVVLVIKYFTVKSRGVDQVKPGQN